MRCPKCRYLSFEPEPRCRNCGYELSLGPHDLVIKTEETPAASFPDLALHLLDEPKRDSPGAIDFDSFDSMVGFSTGRPDEAAKRSKDSIDSSRHSAESAPLAPAAPTVSPAGPSVAAPAELDLARASENARRPARSTELPLFVQSLPQPDAVNDVPMVKLPPAPRPPLGVRRPTPDPARLRAKYPRVVDGGKPVDPVPLKAPLAHDLLDLDAGSSPPPADRLVPRIQTNPASMDLRGFSRESVGPARRLEAALIDAVFIGAINGVLIWLTLRVCGLSIGEVWILPVLPLAAFLFVLDAGYLLMFTATQGQTVGKMVAHIRVVGASAAGVVTDRLGVGQAAVRALLTLPSVMALGLGFLPALVGEGRAVHDRIAHTRVIRA